MCRTSDTTHLALRPEMTLRDWILEFTFFSARRTAYSSNYSAQWFRMRETTTLAFFSVNISQDFPREKICKIRVSNRDTLERKSHYTARRTNLPANPSPPFDVSLSIVWWITCRCRCTFPVTTINTPCAWWIACMTCIIDSRDSIIADACSAEFLPTEYTCGWFFEFIFCLLAHHDRRISIGYVK